MVPVLNAQRLTAHHAPNRVQGIGGVQTRAGRRVDRRGRFLVSRTKLTRGGCVHSCSSVRCRARWSIRSCARSILGLGQRPCVLLGIVPRGPRDQGRLSGVPGDLERRVAVLGGAGAPADRPARRRPLHRQARVHRGRNRRRAGRARGGGDGRRGHGAVPRQERVGANALRTLRDGVCGLPRARTRAAGHDARRSAA